jgi:c-di-GMP-binding flagellar brake protein YcgR
MPTDALDDYRISNPVEILALLQQLLDSNALITLSAPNGSCYTTLLRSVDARRGLICLSASAHDAPLQSLLSGDEVLVVAYLNSIKVQFDLVGAVLVSGAHDQAINAQMPTELFRFQRRSAFRVRPLNSRVPVAQFPHPSMPDMTLSLRVLDISLSGLALFLPANVPPIAAGVRIGQCLLKLDDDTQVHMGLLIQHVTDINPDAQGARLGCELLSLDRADRSLQDYINQTQKRRLALPTSAA